MAYFQNFLQTRKFINLQQQLPVQFLAYLIPVSQICSNVNLSYNMLSSITMIQNIYRIVTQKIHALSIIACFVATYQYHIFDSICKVFSLKMTYF